MSANRNQGLMRRLQWMVLVGLAVFLARKGAAVLWRRITGDEPPSQAEA